MFTNNATWNNNHLMKSYLQLPISSPSTEVVNNGGAVDVSMCSFESVLVFVLSLSGPRNNSFLLIARRVYCLLCMVIRVIGWRISKLIK